MTVKPFYWSVRRELWENRSIWIAPLAVAGLVFLAFAAASFNLPHWVQTAATNKSSAQHLNLPYAAGTGAVFLVTWLVAIFYSLGALNGERRDRSILFWKSLPVSDMTTVLSKAAIPLLVQPVILLVVAYGLQLAMLAWSAIILLINGMSPALLWQHLHLPMIWFMLPYGLLLNILWDVPFYGWLLLVSAWAKRMTFVWAAAPWFGAALFEAVVTGFQSKWVIRLIEYRVFGGASMAWTAHGDGKTTLTALSQIDPVGFLANLPLWTGMAFGAACLAACIWLRRRAEPI